MPNTRSNKKINLPAQEVVDRWSSDPFISYEDLGRQYNCSGSKIRQTIYAHLGRAKMREIGKQRGVDRRKIDPTKTSAGCYGTIDFLPSQEILELFKSGLLPMEIAERFNVKPDTISRLLRNHLKNNDEFLYRLRQALTRRAKEIGALRIIQLEDWQKREIVRLYREDIALTKNEIADRVNTTCHAVSGVIRELLSKEERREIVRQKSSLNGKLAVEAIKSRHLPIFENSDKVLEFWNSGVSAKSIAQHYDVSVFVVENFLERHLGSQKYREEKTRRLAGILNPEFQSRKLIDVSH